MDLQKLRNELIRYEGCKDKVYLDTKQLKTVGIGHLLKGPETSMAVGTQVSLDQINKWFDNDVQEAIEVARRAVPDLDSLDDCRQRVITQLAFNLGSKLLTFTNTLRMINNKDFTRAADNLQQSLWFNQVGRRGPETCFALRTGAYGWCKP